MAFSDNLENDLKSLEKAEEWDPAALARQQAAREAARAEALAIQPHAQELRNSKFTTELLNQATLQGRALRLLVRITWLGQNLRLQARDHVLELVPTPRGVTARFLRGEAEIETYPVDFSASAEDLARRWITSHRTAP